jgi:hypothetical protein
MGDSHLFPPVFQCNLRERACGLKVPAILSRVWIFSEPLANRGRGFHRPILAFDLDQMRASISDYDALSSLHFWRRIPI